MRVVDFHLARRALVIVALTIPCVFSQTSDAQDHPDDQEPTGQFEFDSEKFRQQPLEGIRIGREMIREAEYRMRPLREIAELRNRVASLAHYHAKDPDAGLDLLTWSFDNAHRLMDDCDGCQQFLASVSLTAAIYRATLDMTSAQATIDRAMDLISDHENFDEGWRETMMSDLVFLEAWLVPHDDPEAKIAIMEPIFNDIDPYLKHFETSLMLGHWAVIYCYELRQVEGSDAAWEFAISTADDIDESRELSNNAQLISMAMLFAHDLCYQEIDGVLPRAKLAQRLEYADRLIERLEDVNGIYRLEALDMAIAIDCAVVTAVPDHAEHIAKRINRRFEVDNELFFFQSEHRNLSAFDRAIRIFYLQLSNLVPRTSVDRIERCFDLALSLVERLELSAPDDGRIAESRGRIAQRRERLRRSRK